ncbi:hypothetical protein KP509_1Z276400 [Ceratopteris richardii]|nr:hypothetical protein KP509_1Z276400 [Ceratopteris richardii]
MREEGFIQTAEVARQQIVDQGGSDLECTKPCLSSSEVAGVVQSIHSWQENIKGRDTELQKIQNSRSSILPNGASEGLSNVRKSCHTAVQEDDGIKVHKDKKVAKKDIRSGREYYEGWEKYVAQWEKENVTSEEMDKAAPALEFSKESMNQNMDRNERTVEPKSLVEREWLANREREKGNDLFKMNRHEEAHADCCEALKLDPMNVKAFMRRAKASFEMSEYMKALNDVKEVLKYNPTNEEALSLKKKVEDVLKKQNGSDILCEASLPDGKRLKIEEIESDDLDMQTYGAAAKDEQENLELMADDLRVKGNTFFAEKNFEKAHEYYSKSLSYVPDSVTVLCNRSLCEIRLKNYERAEMDASKALAIDPNYAKAFHHRGLARHALGKLADAMKDLQVGYQNDYS